MKKVEEAGNQKYLWKWKKCSYQRNWVFQEFVVFFFFSSFNIRFTLTVLLTHCCILHLTITYITMWTFPKFPKQFPLQDYFMNIFNWRINRLEKDQKDSFYMFFSKCLLHFSADLLVKLIKVGRFSLGSLFFFFFWKLIWGVLRNKQS